MLLGNATDKVQSWGHDRLSTFGIGTEFTKDEWLALVSDLLRRGYIEEGEHRTLQLASEGVEALREERTIVYTRPRFLKKSAKRSRGAAREAAPASYEEALFEQLRALRKRLADEQGVPPYVIFSDATLRELSSRKPKTLQDFRATSGVGDVKLERYGEVFIAEIAAYDAAGA